MEEAMSSKIKAEYKLNFHELTIYNYSHKLIL